MQSWHIVAPVAELRRGAHSKISIGAQARLLEEGSGRERSGLPGEAPHVCEPGSLVSVSDEPGQLGLSGCILKHFPGSFTTLRRPIRPAKSCSDDGALGSWRCGVY